MQKIYSTKVSFNFIKRLLHTDYIGLIESCIQSKSLTQGKQVHQHILISDNLHINNPYISQKLAHLYVSCNQIDLARHLLDTISEPSVVFYNMMIRAYAWNGPFERALDLYYEMLQLGVAPNKYTFPFVLKACSALQALEDGEVIHGHAKRLGLDVDTYVCTALVDLYAKCGDLGMAKWVFDGMSCRDVVAWNAMIAGFSLHGLYCDTVWLFVQMQKDGILPNNSTIVAVLPTITAANELKQGKALHGYCLKRSFNNDVVVATGILDMYAKCGCISYVTRVFNLMSGKNEVAWCAMIGAYVTWNCMQEAIELFYQMMMEDARSLTPAALGTVLQACAKLTDLSRGRHIHGLSIKTGFCIDIMVGNTLVSMYAKCGIIDDAVIVFDEMELKDTITYNAIISGCSQNGYAKEGMHIFFEMQSSGVEPDSATMVSILPIFSHLAAWRHGSCAHSYAIVTGFTAATSVCNALIDLYSKSGKINTARKVFDGMERRNIVSWNTMIDGYGIHGLCKEALVLFGKMEGLKPDGVTFICLLSACSHSGLVREGKQLFDYMIQGLNIVPKMDHYICMVDLLGRSGFLDEAYKFIDEMPFEPNVHAWGALLAACRTYKNVELGEIASKKIQMLGEPEGTNKLVLLSNMYSTVGRWDEAEEIRTKQRDQGFKKNAGCSWVEINGVRHMHLLGEIDPIQKN